MLTPTRFLVPWRRRTWAKASRSSARPPSGTVLQSCFRNSYNERPGYARADAPQVLEEGEAREGEGRGGGEAEGGAEGERRAAGGESPEARTRGETAGAAQARRPRVRRQRRPRRLRRLGAHGAGDEDGLRETDRGVSRRRGGVS